MGPQPRIAVLPLALLFMNSSFARSEVTEEDRLVASDATSEAFFGVSVAVSGDWALVGAHLDSEHGTAAGAAYVFEWGGTAWGQRHKLTAPSPSSGDLLGVGVALAGDTAIVGASGASGLRGLAHVFARSSAGWGHEAELAATDAAPADNFGSSVALSADETTAVIGARNESELGNHAGAAYVFVRSGSTWTQAQKLLASNGSEGDTFGDSVAISDDGNTILVGSRGRDAAAANSGSVYVFVRDTGAWVEQQELVAADLDVEDQFGVSIDLTEDYALIGSFLDDDLGGASGSAYVFERSGSSWTEQAKLLSSAGAAGDLFGTSVSIEGDVALIGSVFDDQVGSNAGAAFLFVRHGSAWIQEADLFATGAMADDAFGRSVAMKEGRIIVGAWAEDELGFSDAGAAYAFRWTLGKAIALGDGTGAACPCWDSVVAGRGCALAPGSVGSLLRADGSLSVAKLGLVLHAEDVVPGQFGLFFQGTNTLAGGLGIPFGNGLRGVAGHVVRFPLQQAGASGKVSSNFDVATLGGASAGETLFYQHWSRTPGLGCSAPFITTNALELTWLP